MSGTHVTAPNIHVDNLDDVTVQVFKGYVWINLGGPTIFVPSSRDSISDKLDGIESFAAQILGEVARARQSVVTS